ncbi:HlyD family efflux transporter periplasmic adaptor subunit [Schlesneria sp. T3-172]|uniref:HlyD family efflux transporter periplasmic adaptor subunit n=1 Tax=Schlesneria sphaerica TaxID=3373610 RepID=UPI0037CBAFB9
MSNDEQFSGNPPTNAGEFLRRLLGELGATVGALWFGSTGQLNLVAASGFEESGFFRGDTEKTLLQQILAEVLKQGRPLSVDTAGTFPAGPTGHATLFLVPLSIPPGYVGVILIAERPNLPQQQRMGWMQHISVRGRELSPLLTSSTETSPNVRQTAGGAEPSLEVASAGPAAAAAPVLAGSPMTASRASVSKRPLIDSQPVLDYVLSLQRSLDLNEVANVVVNDGRLLFAVDRVSLAMVRGRRTVITAVSGQESVHPRGNLIRAMRRLTQLVLASGEPFRYDGSIQNVPQQLEEPLADFIQESGTRFLMIAPLLEPERLVKPDEPPGNGKPKPVVRPAIGALIIEQMSSSTPSTQLKHTLDSVSDHIAAASYNARSHSTIFLLPLWRWAGRCMEWLRGRRLAIAVVLVGLLLVATSALILVPWEYRVEGKGRLMPVTQREVFAPWDGQVQELMVEGGEHVEKDQPLIILHNDDLSAELVKVRSELQEKQKLLHTLKAQADEAERQVKTEEKLRAKGKALETQVEIDGALEQEKILKERLKRLTILAPITGTVTTFQVQQLLENRPVRRGELLLQVMDDQGDWQLELEIAEHRVGRILKAQEASGPNLPIEYRMLTSPESSFQATLTSLGTRIVTDEEKGTVLEARASLDSNQLPSRAIGADVRARISCGESSLGDVLFGDVIEFVQRYLWW